MILNKAKLLNRVNAQIKFIEDDFQNEVEKIKLHNVALEKKWMEVHAHNWAVTADRIKNDLIHHLPVTTETLILLSSDRYGRSEFNANTIFSPKEIPTEPEVPEVLIRIQELCEVVEGASIESRDISKDFLDEIIRAQAWKKPRNRRSRS